MKQSTVAVGVKIMHSAEFSDAERLEDDSTSEESFEELLEDDSSAIPLDVPHHKLYFHAGRPKIFISVPAENKRMVLNSVPSAKFPDTSLEALKLT